MYVKAALSREGAAEVLTCFLLVRSTILALNTEARPSSYE